MTLKRSGVRRRSRNTGPSPEVVALVLERDQYACVCCGEGLHGERGEHWSIQHRRRRDGRPETNLPANLVATCGSGTTGCHGWITGHPLLAREQGLSLRTTEDPLVEPVATWYGVVLLDDAGSFSQLAEAS